MIAQTPSSQPLLAFFETLFLPMRLGGRSEKTKLHYTVAIRHLEKFLSREPLVSDLNDGAVIGCLSALHENGLAPTTVNGYRSEFICLADYAFRKSLIPEAVEVPKLKVPRRIPNTFSEEQMTAILAAARTTSGMVGALPSSLFWPALLLTIYDSAARVSSLLAAEWDDLDWEAGTLRLKGENTKTLKESSKPLYPETMDLLRTIQVVLRDADKVNPQGSAAIAWAKAVGDPARLFPWPYCDGYLWQLFARKIAKPAGLPTDRKWKFHCIRRTTLTITANTLGVSVATDLADHTSDAVTRRAYIDPSRMDDVRPCDILPRPGATVAEPTGGKIRQWFTWLGIAGKGATS